ncbi:acyl-CoA dehydrogenase [Marinomonas balearica]|uniref:3-methylmercaptopropionyl-CoA dehydrogenase n=1 Tax=Marinomonas balearica TaxID=491947 RepID=A0A4R6ME09_9GAMM|nr:acyl-CoA dehydrogenase [Marinomonas balearica]TDO99991.1 alkylation response protein AidB-like acyl-CoA dehydrogenase [Marinomonas balearica]
MSDYRYPYKDVLFSLNQAGISDRLNDFLEEPLTVDLVEAILTESAKLSEQVIAPLNWSGDQEGARLESGDVYEAKGFKDAFSAYVEGGWPSLDGHVDHGGQGLPSTLATAVNEGIQSANLAFSLCPLLSSGAIEALERYGSPSLKNTFLSKLVSGEWTGTMNLTEPNAGSDLAAISAKAVPEGEHFLIQGQKIFITWGDHQMSDNIIHLVLARLPDAPEGVKGISLFLVPKYLVAESGELGARNDVCVASLEHKMGIHASPTCVMAFGENYGAVGYLVGEPNQGLKAMFAMMNNARQGVGLQGLAIAERAYQQATDYAKERKQGYDAARKNRVAIIEHPDVKRMLLTMKALIDASRALIYTAAVENDVSKLANGAEASAASARTALYTPVVKGWITEIAQEVTSLAVQVHGGMGFIEETGVAQHARDARILPIYEGTNGIQAIDLIGRKLQGDNGIALSRLIDEIISDVGLSKSKYAEQVKTETVFFQQTTDLCLSSMKEDPLLGTYHAYAYMMQFGYVVGAWLMLKAEDQMNENSEFDDLRSASIEFYCRQILPRARMYGDMITAGTSTVDSAVFFDK